MLRATQGRIGYNSVMPTAKAILKGTYHYPSEFDEATKEILQECALIHLCVPKNSVSITITSGDWSNHWCPAWEETSSSISSQHFGHYKASLLLQYVSYLQALQATLVVNREVVLERWLNGLSVMLEKIFGCLLITKLQSILLMEADFNATNKAVCGVCMLANMRKYKLMPEELYSKSNHLADDGTLSKVLFYGIV